MSQCTVLAPYRAAPLNANPKAGGWASALACGLTLTLLATAPVAHAQWRWRDASGRVTASDMPPPREVAEKDILSRPTPTTAARNRGFVPLAAASGAAAAGAASAAGAGRSPLHAEVEARRKAQEQEAAAKAKADEERQATQRAENCRRARNQVATLESGIRLQRLNAKGEREVLDDAARAEEMKAARTAVASECK